MLHKEIDQIIADVKSISKALPKGNLSRQYLDERIRILQKAYDTLNQVLKNNSYKKDSELYVIAARIKTDGIFEQVESLLDGCKRIRLHKEIA